MRVRHPDAELERLERDATYSGRFAGNVVKAYRMRMNFLRNSLDERELYAMKSFRFEKLKGARAHQRSLRLNDQWRLIIEFEGEAPNKTVVIVSIEDYHH